MNSGRNLLISNLITKKGIVKFQDFDKKLIHWYKSNYRRLPWRDTKDPYKIWLSEIILQQTRVAQGLPYYEKFIQNFPTIYDLAKAKDDDVLRVWQGLGYYSRARNLLKCARIVAFSMGGKFPESYEELKKLPGIGPYTAAALASFAFHKKVAVVDGNVFRVLSRVFGIKEDISKSATAEYFKDLSEKLMPEFEPDIYNQALMEFGATECLPKYPKCDLCTFSDMCYAFENKCPSMFPIKTSKIKTRNRRFFYVILHNNHGCLMKKRNSGDIWTDLYDFLWIDSQNSHDLTEIIEDKNLQHLVQEPLEIYQTDTVKHFLSHQKLEASFVHISMDLLPKNFNYKDQNMKFYSWDEVIKLPKPVLVNNYLIKMNLINSF